MTVTVRQATDADVAAIVDVGHRTWPATYEPFTGPDYVARGLATWWSVDAIRRGLANTVVAQDESGTIVGMASYAPDGVHLILWKLYVLPEAQGGGAGTALLRKVVGDSECHYDAVRLEYLEGNDRAAKFYERNGFTFLKREPDPNGGPDSMWMERLAPR